MTMESDTYDTYLKKELPDARDICGQPEYFTPGLLDWDSWVLDPRGRDRRQGLHRGHGPARSRSRGPAGVTAAATTSRRRLARRQPELGRRQRRAGGVRPEDLLGPDHRSLGAAQGRPLALALALR